MGYQNSCATPPYDRLLTNCVLRADYEQYRQFCGEPFSDGVPKGIPRTSPRASAPPMDLMLDLPVPPQAPTYTHSTAPPQSVAPVKEDGAVTEHPYDFWCSITTDLMEEPVILIEDGQTYEKEALDDWLLINDISPNTGKVLGSKKSITHLALKNAIPHYKQKHKMK